MESLVDHQRRRVVACAEASDRQHSELAVRAGLTKRDPQTLGEMFAYPVVAHNPATDAVADEDHSPAHRLPEDQVVKGRHAVQLVGRHLKKLGQVADTLVRHPTTAPLNDLQRINTDGAFLRVLMKFRFYLSSLFFSQHGYIKYIATEPQSHRAKGTRRGGDKENLPNSPCLLVSLSPCLSISVSLCLCGKLINDLHQPIQNLCCPGSPADRGPSRRD